MTDTPISLAEVRAAADAATPGEWSVGNTFRFARTTCAEVLIPGHPRGNPFIAENNAAFMAAADPVTVLALVEAVSAAQELHALRCTNRAGTNYLAAIDRLDGALSRFVSEQPPNGKNESGEADETSARSAGGS